MGIENILINMGKEIVLFNSFESFFLLLLFLIAIKQKISIKKCVFHVFMLSISSYVFSTIIHFPIIMQIAYLILISFYFCAIFKIKFIESLKNVTINFLILFVLEVTLAILFQKIINIEFISMDNNFHKFLYMLPIRFIESLFLIYIYRKRKGGEKVYENIKKSYQ